MQNDVEKSCFALVAAAVAECFTPLTTKDNKEKKKKIRREFAKSKLFEVWCDCSENFDKKKLKSLIIKKNI